MNIGRNLKSLGSGNKSRSLVLHHTMQEHNTFIHLEKMRCIDNLSNTTKGVGIEQCIKSNLADIFDQMQLE